MKWKEFKEKVEKQGVTEETEITYIDVDGYGYPEVVLEKFVYKGIQRIHIQN